MLPAPATTGNCGSLSKRNLVANALVSNAIIRFDFRQASLQIRNAFLSNWARNAVKTSE